MDLPDIGTAEEMHDFATWFADAYQRQFHARFADRSENVVSASLLALMHDAVLCHRGVGALVAAGWASTGPSLIRTILDLSVSALAIVNSARPTLAAFKYLHAGYRAFSRSSFYKAATRAGTRELLRSRMKQLEPEDRPEALAFLRARERSYWFGDEWRSPMEVVSAFGTPSAIAAYRDYSAAAHGGFLGGRIFRDRPFDLDIGPRLSSGKTAAVILLGSSRHLIELVCLRDQWERSGFGGVCTGIRAKFERVRIPD
jgi:hypothetical protein